MRKIREVLRLYFAAALSIRAIARSLGTSPSTVGEYLHRAKVAEVSWPVAEAIAFIRNASLPINHRSADELV